MVVYPIIMSYAYKFFIPHTDEIKLRRRRLYAMHRYVYVKRDLFLHSIFIGV